MNGDITFDTYDLQTFDPELNRGIITNLIDHTSIPDKQATLVPKADANGGVIPTINYPQKIIKIGGTIKGADQYVSEVLAYDAQQDLDMLIDQFKAYFNGKNKHLDIAYGNTTRRYIATANAIGISREQKMPIAKFSVEFVCPQPFGIELTPTNIANEEGYTAATLTVEPVIGGSAPFQLPVATITINALTGDADTLQFSNDLNGQQMLLTGLGFEAGDVIVIDAANRSVTVNDVEVDYYGTFLELEPGANSLTYTDSFTTRDVDILIEYYKRYL